MNKRRHRKYLSPRIRIGEQFIAHPVALLKSEAWRSLKLAELRILHRLEIEHASHGGRQNGNLPCTRSNFERHGVRRKNITKALDKLVRLGLVEITVKGRMAYADLRTPSRFRLTYLPTYDEIGAAVPPTHEWRRLEKQKARGDLTPQARGDLTPTEVEKPGAICTPMPGAMCTPLSRSRVDGRGLGGAEVLSSVLSVPPSSAWGEAGAAPPVSQPSPKPSPFLGGRHDPYNRGPPAKA